MSGRTLYSDLTSAFVLDAAAGASAGGVDIVIGHVSSVERYRLTTGSGDDVITHLSGSGNVIATNSGDDTVSFDHVTGSNVFAAGDGEDHLTVDFSIDPEPPSTFAVAGNNFAGAVGVNSWNGGDFGSGAGSASTMSTRSRSSAVRVTTPDRAERRRPALRQRRQRCSRRGRRDRHGELRSCCLGCDGKLGVTTAQATGRRVPTP